MNYEPAAGAEAVFVIDPKRIDLAMEYRDRPFGHHSSDLQCLLNAMRMRDTSGRYVLVMTKPQEEWRLARMTRDSCRGPELTDTVFHRLEDAEWYVFRKRWEEMTGEALAID